MQPHPLSTQPNATGIQTRKHRLFAVEVHDGFTRQFTVPEWEVGVLKEAWPGRRVDVTPMSEFRDYPDNADIVFQNLIARYGEKAVLRYHPGAYRLSQDMERSARDSDALMRQVLANIDAEERKRVAAERDAAAQRQAYADEHAAQERQKEAEAIAKATAAANANITTTAVAAARMAVDEVLAAAAPEAPAVPAAPEKKGK